MEIREITAEETRPIRREVLRPGLPESEVHLPGDEDPSSFHLGAFDEGRLVGIATFIAEPCPASGAERDWRLRGMATIAQVRGRGIGGRLLDTGVGRVAQSGGRRVWCNGRTSARRFYEQHGFTVVGDEFELPHTGSHFLFVLTVEHG